MGERRESVIESNGIAGMLFGVPFMLIGLGAMLGGAWLVVVKDAPIIVLILMIPFSAVFMGFGGFASLYRHWLIIDFDQQTVERAWGFLVPFKRELTPLGVWTEVQLSQARRRTQKSSYIVFPVCLARADERLVIQSSRSYARARRVAERFAKAGGLGIRDSVGADVLVREAQKLDESLRDRSRRTAAEIHVPVRPPTSRAQLSHDMGTLVIDLPAPGWRSGAGAMMALVVCALIGQTLVIGLSEGEVPLPFFGIGVAVAIAMLVPLARHCLTSESVRVSPAAVEIIYAWPLGERHVRMGSDKLEELRLGALGEGAWFGPGIVAICDDRLECFAAGFDEAERRWLAAELLRALVA